MTLPYGQIKYLRHHPLNIHGLAQRSVGNDGYEPPTSLIGDSYDVLWFQLLEDNLNQFENRMYHNF